MTTNKQFENPLQAWFRQVLKNVLFSLRYRILFLLLDAILIAFLVVWLQNSLQYARDSSLVSQLLILGFFIFFLIFPSLYCWRTFLQISQEILLCVSIYNVRKEVERIKKGKKSLRGLQFKTNKARRELKDFIDYSEVVSPPIFSYELTRLHKGIDTFFNSTSEALFWKPNAFSRAQRIEEQRTLDMYAGQEEMTEDVAEQYEEMVRQEEGVIDWFGIDALDEFLQYLGDNLFAKAETFPPFSYKHPIDLITLSRFFEAWNLIVSSCRNCKGVFEKSREDIEKYYEILGKREIQRRQRMSKLADSVFVIVISVVVSVIVNYLIKVS